jgi:hypothetical protein
MTAATTQPPRRYDSYAQFAEYYSESGWTDGLPIVPPTVQKVRSELRYLGLDPRDPLGDIPSQDVTVLAEHVVVNAVMAGCRREHLPVVIAAVRAFLEPEANAHGTTGSLASPAHMVLVNGPARKTLDINCTAGCFGPGRRSNAVIGRALRLVIRNCCNAIPGFADRAAFSQPARYSFCFGEDEESGVWTPLHEERGFHRDDNVVTVASFTEMYALRDVASQSPEDLLKRLASVARGRPVHVDHVLGDKRTVLFVFGPEHRSLLATNDWTKQDVRAFLFPLLVAPPTTLDIDGRPYGWGSHAEGGLEESTFGLPRPEGILIATAGGAGMGLTYVFYPHWSAAVSRRF